MATALTDQHRLTTRTDRRQTYRVAVTQPLPIAIQYAPGQSDGAVLKDLSEAGCLLHSPHLFATGETLALLLELPQPVCITEARIIWTNESWCGLAFVRVSPIERARLWRFLWKHFSHASAGDLQPLITIAEEPPYSRAGLQRLP